MQPFEVVDFKYTNELLKACKSLLRNHNRIITSNLQKNSIIIDTEKEPNKTDLQNFYNATNPYIEPYKSDLQKHVQTIKLCIEPFKNELLKYSQTFSPKGFKQVLKDLKSEVIKMQKIAQSMNSNDMLGSPAFDLFKTNHTIMKIITDYVPESEIEKKELEQPQKDKITTKQQILILHYLDIIENLCVTETTKKAKLLSFIFNRHEQNIRTVLTNMPNVKYNSKNNPFTPDNMEFVKNIFSDIGLNDIVRKIENDIKEKNK
jgi:hypothetical protein